MLVGGPQNAGKTFPPEPLTAEEVRLIIRATSKRGLCGVRDRALIAMLYRAGLRISELLNLKPKDVDLDTGNVTVLRGKGKKRRVVAVDVESVALLRHWLDKREAWGIGVRSPLFCTLKGTPMSDTQVRDHLKALARKAGVEKRVHPHGFRHTFASELADEKTDIRIIQASLGHGHLSTTDTYIRKLNPTVVLDHMRARSWNPEEK